VRVFVQARKFVPRITLLSELPCTNAQTPIAVVRLFYPLAHLNRAPPGRFEEAKTMLIRSLQEHPNWAPTYRFLASCYAQMGRLDEAREVVERLRSITSVIIPTGTHWRDAEQRELYLSGLRLAAGEAE